MDANLYLMNIGRIEISLQNLIGAITLIAIPKNDSKKRSQICKMELKEKKNYNI